MFWWCDYSIRVAGEPPRVGLAKLPAYDPLFLFVQLATLFATTAFMRSCIASVHRATLARGIRAKNWSVPLWILLE